MNIKITNPNKIIYQKGKIKKIDVINYYIDISELMLPHLDNRLLSVIRCHQGVKGECFFKKHPTTEKENVEIYLDGDEEYFYVKNQSQLIYQVQLGTIEFHTWASNVKKIDKPNIMVFDLDPDENLSLEELRKGVKNLKDALDELNLKSYLKTSGGKGYHIVVPFCSSPSWQRFEEFAKQIAMLLESKFPKMYTTNIRKNERNGKIFVDYLRNGRGATCVAPYSLRARENAPISMPIDWSDLDKIKPNEITIKNYKSYLDKNVWKDFFTTSQKLK